MKSNPKDQLVRTNCKNCVFAIYDNNEKPTQIGCHHDRIQKYKPDIIEAYDEEKEFYVINRLCLYYREQKWGYSHLDKEKVKEESALSFDIIFDCRNLNKNKADAIIKFLCNNDYYKSKLNVVLVHEEEVSDEIKQYVQKIASSYREITISVCHKIEYFLHGLLKKTKQAYHCLVVDPETLNLNVFNKLNSYVNTDLKKFVFAECGFGNRFVGNFKYKSLNDFNPSVLYFENVDEIEALCQNTQLYISI